MSAQTEWKERLEKSAAEVEAEGVAIFVNDPPARRARLLAWVGEKPREWVPFGVTPLGECAADGRTRQREVRNTKAEKYHSYLYVPVLGNGRVLGVVVFSAVKPDLFTLESLQELAFAWTTEFANVIKDSNPCT